LNVYVSTIFTIPTIPALYDFQFQVIAGKDEQGKEKEKKLTTYRPATAKTMPNLTLVEFEVCNGLIMKSARITIMKSTPELRASRPATDAL
jgi:hypothetical protein